VFDSISDIKPEALWKKKKKCLLYGPCPYEKNGWCKNKEDCEMKEGWTDQFLNSKP
jgi:hypothetical protein